MSESRRLVNTRMKRELRVRLRYRDAPAPARPRSRRATSRNSWRCRCERCAAPRPAPGRDSGAPRRLRAAHPARQADRHPLLLWPTLSALWLAAHGTPAWSLVLIFTVGTILMRSAGCAVNDWADRHFDAHVERTAGRPLAGGEIAAWEALAGRRGAGVLRLPAGASRPTAQPSCFRFRRSASPSSIRSSSASSCCRRRSSASPSRSAFRWRTRPSTMWCRRSHGGCCCSTCSGSSPTTPSTRWSTATTTCDSACARRRSHSGGSTCAPVMACYAVYLGGMVAVGMRQAMGPLYYVGLAVALGVRGFTTGRSSAAATAIACFRAFLHNHWLGLAVFAGIALDHAVRLRAWPRCAVSRRAGRPRCRRLAAGARCRRDARVSSSSAAFRARPRSPPASTTRIRATISGRSSAAVIGVPLPALPYARRLARIAGAAASACGTRSSRARRRGSLDGAIRDAEHGGDRARAPRRTGALARLLQRPDRGARGGRWRDAGYATLALPSSSPAYTRPFAEKLAAWRAIGAFLHDETRVRE